MRCTCQIRVLVYNRILRFTLFSYSGVWKVTYCCCLIFVGLALREEWTYPDQILLNSDSTLLDYGNQLILPKYVSARLFFKDETLALLVRFSLLMSTKLEAYRFSYLVNRSDLDLSKHWNVHSACCCTNQNVAQNNKIKLSSISVYLAW